MRLLTLEQVSPNIDDTVFRPSPIASFVVGLICIVLAAVIIAASPLLPAIVIGTFFVLFSLIPFSSFKKALSPDSWLLVAGPQRILIKFRSYLNPNLPANDAQVIELRLANIRSARITKQRVEKYGQGRKGGTSIQCERLTFLDIFAGIDLTPVKERLKYERTVMGESNFLGVKAKGKTHHYPVSVCGDNCVRIQWNGVSPGVKKATALLERMGITIAPLNKESLDFTLSAVEKSNMEDKVLQLIERGDTFAAARLLREAHGLSLAEAKQFIQSLTKSEIGKEKHGREMVV